MKKMCELCRQAPESDMRYGVSLCDNCRNLYSQAAFGDLEAARTLANPQNFPDATEKAIQNIIEPTAKQFKQTEAFAKQKEQADQCEQERVEYAKSIGVQYPSSAEDNYDGMYSNIGSKIKSGSKGFFIVSAILSVVCAFSMMMAGDLGILLGLAFLVIGPLAALVSSWLLYAYGELVDKTCATEHHTRTMLKVMLQKNEK